MHPTRVLGVVGSLRTPLLLVGVILLGGAVAMLGREPEQAEANAARVNVVVQRPNLVARPTFIAVSGEVEAQLSADVGFSTGGVVARVGPEEGEFVRAGQLLAELDPLDYRLNLELAAAGAAAAADQFRRAKQVYERESLAPADFAKIEAAFRQATAQEALARKRLSDTRLLAPLSGVVARRGVDPAEHAAPGVPVFSIVAMDPVQVRVGVPEAEIGRISVGQTAAITLPSLPGLDFEGRVALVGVTADPVSRTYGVKIAVPNPEQVLRPGMIAEARIRGSTMMRILTIPGEAIVRDVEGATLVYVYFPQERRVYGRRVEVGSVYGKEVEITSGLTGDDLIVVGGQHRVREGLPVVAQEATAAPSGGRVR